jgi:hypothetical protein
MPTNFLQWNPGSNNQDTDAEYLADSQRSNGAANGQIFDDKTANKLFYQCSTFVASLAASLSAKGYTVNDTSAAALQTVLANILTNADLRANQITVNFSTNPTFDANLANGFRFGLSGNVTSSSLINGSIGQIVTFFIVSQNPGNFSFVWPSNVSNPGNVQTQSTGNLFVQQFITDGSTWFPVETLLTWLQQQLAITNGNVTTAQNTANGAQSTANTANGTANTALTNANNAQSSANAAQGTANSAQSSANTALSQIAALLNGGSLSSNGWFSMPIAGSKLIVQWTQGISQSSTATVTQTINFPVAFPNAVFKVLVTDFFTAGADNDIMAYQATGWNNSSVSVRRVRRGDESTNYVSTPIVFAIGF